MTPSLSTSRPIVTVDIGNSAIKAASYQSADYPFHSPPIVRLNTSQPDHAQLLTLVDDQICDWWIGSVHRPAAQQFCQWLSQTRPQDHQRLVSFRELPLSIGVQHPERVGIDRLLSAIAVNALRCLDRPAIIVDAGSAVTVDVVDAEGTFRGGAIFPGAALMAHALAIDTDQLPLVGLATADSHGPSGWLGSPPRSPIGTSTSEAITAGIAWSVVGGIRELIASSQRQLTAPADCFLTGGDGSWLAEPLGESLRYLPDLVLRGLWIAARHAEQLELKDRPRQ